jgi:hypothetical protein
VKRALLLLAACGSDHLAVDPRCNPLGFDHCAVPFPSSAFEIADASSATGRRVAIPAGALPQNMFGTSIDPTGWNLADGFSPSAPIVFAFPHGVSSDGLVGYADMTASTTPASPTVLVDMTTGTTVAHFAEVDAAPSTMPNQQALFMRPAQRLVSSHRYAVAITTRVKDASGHALPISAGFAALVDGKHTDHPLLEAMRARFPDVLAALAAAGYAKSDLVVAVDFTVASDAFLHRDMIATRDRTLGALDAHPIGFTIQTDAPIGDGSVIARRITGTFDAPLYLNTPNTGVSHTKIVRDGDGLPALQGFYQIPFSAIVPACAYTAAQPVGMVVYGHGLLGESTEATGGVQQTTASELCMVFVGTNMRGMSTEDIPAVATALNDVSFADEVFEVLEQGLSNHVALVRAARTTFATQLFVDAANGNRSLVDPTAVYYYGLSQGGIFGASVMAYEPTMTRAVLGVGAANYSTLLDRSSDWTTYAIILQGAYPDRLDQELGITLCQARWDKTEPSGIADVVLAGTATGVPAKQLLLQNALGDDEVSNVGTYWEARTMGIPVVTPSPFTPWGLSPVAAPLASGSALVLYDGGAAPLPPSDTPPAKLMPSMHDLTRNAPAARRQIRDFYATGQIVNECAGACTCTTGACN